MERKTESHYGCSSRLRNASTNGNYHEYVARTRVVYIYPLTHARVPSDWIRVCGTYVPMTVNTRCGCRSNLYHARVPSTTYNNGYRTRIPSIRGSRNDFSRGLWSRRDDNNIIIRHIGAPLLRIRQEIERKPAWTAIAIIVPLLLFPQFSMILLFMRVSLELIMAPIIAVLCDSSQCEFAQSKPLCSLCEKRY